MSSSQLTAAQVRVASLVVKGWTNDQIAHALSISEQTVKNHLVAIFRKMKVENRVELTLKLLGSGKDKGQVVLRRGA